MWGECGRGGGGWVSLFLSGGVEFVYITVRTYLTWLALLDVDVYVVWCGGGVEDVLGAGVDLGARRSSESARLLQPWQQSLVPLGDCRSHPSPPRVPGAGGAYGLLRYPPKTERVVPEGLYEHHWCLAAVVDF